MIFAEVCVVTTTPFRCIRDGTGQDFLDPTRPVNFKIIAGWPTGRSVSDRPGRPVSDRPGRPVFLRKVFAHCLMYLMTNFQKGGGAGVKICDFWQESQKKTQKICVFCKNDLILRLFLVKFRFERPVLSSAKCTQNKHKKHWRAQAKLLNVLSNDIMRKTKKWSYNFLAIGDRLFAICRAANTKLFFGSAAFAVTKRQMRKKNNSRR